MTQEIVSLIESRAWYPLVAALLTLALRAWTRYGPALVIPREWQWVPPVAAAAAGGFIDAAASGAGLHAALTLAAYAGATVGLGAIGLHHTAKRLAK